VPVDATLAPSALPYAQPAYQPIWTPVYPQPQYVYTPTPWPLFIPTSWPLQPQRVQAIADFGAAPWNQNVFGSVAFSQEAPNGPTTVTVNLIGSSGGGTRGDGNFGEWHVHEFPVDVNAADKCGAASVGGHYNPNGGVYPCNKLNPSSCELGDLSGIFGVLQSSNYQNTFTDTSLPLSGALSIIGKSMVVHDSGGNRWVCATIMPVAAPLVYAPTVVAPWPQQQNTPPQLVYTQPQYVGTGTGSNLGTGSLASTSNLAGGCRDMDAMCAQYAAGSGCAMDYVSQNCRLSCGTCGRRQAASSGPCQPSAPVKTREVSRAADACLRSAARDACVGIGCPGRVLAIGCPGNGGVGAVS
jgi:Cu/Zn superoxide dismutase